MNGVIDDTNLYYIDKEEEVVVVNASASGRRLYNEAFNECQNEDYTATNNRQ